MIGPKRQCDQRGACSYREQRSHDLIDAYLAEHQIRVFAQRFQKKASDSVPGEDGKA